jgi:uncharacterized membrane protein YuzA (DUF378 family)
MAVTHTYETDTRNAARSTAVRRFNAIDWIAMTLLIVGGLNWGLVGLADFNPVAAIFGDGSALSRLVYILVGVAALFCLYTATKMGRRTGSAA